MKKKIKRYTTKKRVCSLLMAMLVFFVNVPIRTNAESTAMPLVVGQVSTVADPDTVSRPVNVYGDNTLNAGKVTVGKSVSDSAVSLVYGNKTQVFTPGDDNFIVTVSQAAQVMGMSSKSNAPVDVVFVLDTSNSMSGGRAASMVEAANQAIAALMEANEYNRVGVVAFSGVSGSTPAANQLSALAHYDDVDGNNDGDLNDSRDIPAASEHLYWVNRYGQASNSGSYIQGRGTNAGRRAGISGGTNIHAGVALGAKMLTNASTTVEIDGKPVTRIPFLVILSDGAPTYSCDTSNWYSPSVTDEQGPGNGFYAGNGFLPALTAAYYKGVITEHYFGQNASDDKRCYVYTIGVGLDSLDSDAKALARITMDPATYFAAGSTNTYYNGNGDNDFYSYWSEFTAETVEEFEIQVSRSGYFDITANSIQTTRNYILGLNAEGKKMYTSKGIAYNDDYFKADDAQDINAAFNKALQEIQLKAISSPTYVDESLGADFSGYVTLTDPIGEYMEVKQMFGLLADGNFYRGQTFAQKIANWGDDPDFVEHFTKVLQERCRITGASMDVDALIAAIVASPNQAYYNSPNDYDNSFVWWGNGFTAAGEEDELVQYLAFADNDSIEYIEEQKAAGTIPAGADYVCRSYYFYGSAGGTVENPNLEYLHFVIRVQRSLTAPYQQTVVVSAPALLLSVEKVMITENKDNNGNVTYTAAVTEAEPARVVYEVGLRSDINPFNVEQVLAEDQAYLNETAMQNGSAVHTNYDAEAGTYSFYTNDWDRTKAQGSHERAMTKATFDAAPNNSFYTYTEDTPIYVKSGDSYVLYTGENKPIGTGYYYARTVYDWSGSELVDGAYAATVRTEYITVALPDTSAVVRGTDGWYIAKGAYKASSLTGGEDVYKSSNNTATSEVVVHPHRTVSETNSHYTVYLGNNGKLTLQSEETKRVDITKADQTQIRNADGEVVMVGDILTYTIKVVNGGDTTADATVRDIIPVGTEYVEGSASNGGIYDPATNTINWILQDVAPQSAVTVSFQVVVTEAALSGDLDVVNIENSAYVVLDNGFEYTTNPVENPPEGKKVVGSEGDPIEGGVEVGDVLVYRIRYYNDTDTAATVTVRDIIPTGTTYVDNSASHGGIHNAADRTITWVIENVQPGASGVVSFRVFVDGSAGEYIENDASIQIGNNDPRQTNGTQVSVYNGDLILSKVVADNGYVNASAQEFVLNITDIGLHMNGTWEMTKNGQTVPEGITFVNGVATVTIKHGDVIRIYGIPAGTIISVTEAAKNGFTPSYTVNGSATDASEGRVTIVAEEAVSVAVSNSYAPAGVVFQLEGTKKLETALPLEEVTFGFTAYGCDEKGENIDTSRLLTGEVTVSSVNNEAAIVFSPVTYTTVGTYHYLISEINGAVTGINYAQNQYLLTVVVSDDGSGALKATATLKQRDSSNGTFGQASDYADSEVTFVNTYVPVETQIQLEGTKVLTGRTLKADEFSFVVMDDSGAIVSTGTNSADGKILFRPITYTSVGDYVYTITEVNGGLNGVEYATISYTVTVKVEDVDGRLVATVTYPNNGLTFTNVYTPDDVSVTLSGTKSLTGRALTAGEFNFIVTDTNGNVVATGTNDTNGNIAFTAIGYSMDDVGEHVYTVSEVKPDVAVNPNMYYDPITFQVKVTVSYNAETGTLSASQPVVVNGPVAFNNIQNPDSVEITPVAGKTTSNAPNDDISFSFAVINTQTGNEAASGVGTANGDVVFSVMSYSEPGTYTYWIVESNAGNTTNGITYDSTRYLMKVVVSRNETNKLVASVTYWASNVDGSTDVADYTVPVNKPSFENSYAASGYINITATKNLTGRDLRDGEFAFKLIRQDNGGEIDGIVAADGTVTFATMYYSLADLNGHDSVIIHYVMSEVIPEAAKQPGMTYDTNSYDVYVKLTNDGNGNIVAQLVDAEGNPFPSNHTGVTFRNVYAPVEGTSAVITANKTLSGRPLENGEFGFQLFHITANGTENLVATAVNGADGSIVFPTRNYPANILNGADSAEFKYVIREVNNNRGGITYSNASYWVIVTITDNKAAGKLESSVKYYADEACTREITDLENVRFSNTYKAAGTAYTPVAEKVLTNRSMSDNEFSFVVENEKGEIVSTGFSKADGTVGFTPIGYNAAGTYYYTVREVKGNLVGVTYTDVVYYLKVVVTVNLDGTMTAVGSYYSDAQHQNEVSKATFTNIYTPSNVSVQLRASKKLTGRDMAQGEFSFVVVDKDGNVVATGGNAAAADDVSADVVFSNIGYSFADLNGAASRDFVYAISELKTTQGGVTFTEAVFYAKVTLTNNAQTGALETSVKYYTDAACTNEVNSVDFVNAYAPAPASLVIPADKTLINKVIEAGEFTFTLKDASGAVLQTKTNDANGAILFDALSFTVPGTYTYIVSESVTDPENASNYTLDSDFLVVVTVVDNEDGQLIATATYHKMGEDGSYGDANLGGVEFINYYTAPALTVPLNTEIGATKTVQTPGGITYSPEGFQFAVTDVTGTIIQGRDNNGQAVDMIGISDAEGNIQFPNFYFERAGEYHYWIKEMDSDKGGILEDGRTWEVHILVRYDETTGLLLVNDSDVKTYLVGSNSNEESQPAFVNVYESAPAKLLLYADKQLTGRDLRDREFLFYLMEGDVIAAQGYNDVNGNIRFEVTYTAIGTHTYTIKEYIPINGLGGVTYDEKEYASVTVEVKDDGNGQLVVYLNGEPLVNGAAIDTGVTIENNYEAAATHAIVHANKLVTNGVDMAAGDYTFLLTNKADPEDVYVASNDETGLIVFRVDYTKPGVYTYTISEKKGDKGGITYDESSYEVTVTVTDDGNGQLYATVAYADGKAPTFVNTYKAEPTTAQIKAHKTLNGDKPLAAEKYTFELERSDGVIVTATNQDNGDIIFNLKYDEAGEYTYILREVKGDELGTTYDETEYEVTVTVVDNYDGTLTATVVYEGLDAGKVPSFVNSYKGQAVPVQVSANKKLTGKTLAGEDFTFTLTNKDDPEEVYTVKNTAEGDVVFSLTFENAGTYTYLLAETAGTDDNITYDSTVYTVTITVTDDLNGYLVAEVEYDSADGAAPVFQNVFAPDPVEVTIEAEKNLTGRKLKADEFSFELKDVDGVVVATAKNTADGKIVFANIQLTAAGNYTFTVSEVNGGNRTVVYDTTKFTVTVEVVQDGDMLTATVTYPENGVVFKNTYHAPDPSSPVTGDETPIMLLFTLMALSGMAMIGLLFVRRRGASNYNR